LSEVYDDKSPPSISNVKITPNKFGKTLTPEVMFDSNKRGKFQLFSSRDCASGEISAMKDLIKGPNVLNTNSLTPNSRLDIYAKLTDEFVNSTCAPIDYYNHDDIAPTFQIQLHSAYTNPVNQSSFVIEIKSNEDVIIDSKYGNPLDMSDVSVVNGACSHWNFRSNTATCRVTPQSAGEVRIKIDSGKAQDLAGNNNTASNELVVTYAPASLWADITTSNGVASSCTANKNNCTMRDPSALWWSKTQQTLHQAAALSICAGLNHNGQTDWRLATGDELRRAEENNIYEVAGTNGWIHAGDWISQGDMQNCFWSSSSDANDTSKAECVNLETGVTTIISKDNSQLYVCVRQ
jgi:hypothetical protein